MSHLRSAVIAIDHLVAEMAAAPLASAAALRLGVTALHSQLDLRAAGASPANQTARLWRETEHGLARACPAVSIDELTAVRDRVWFGQVQRVATVPLHEFLTRVARSHLSQLGGSAVPCLRSVAASGDTSEGEILKARARESWRWMTFAIPPDLLLAALGKGSWVPVAVDMLAPQIAHELREHGFAETHLHLGAAFEFGPFWITTLAALADSDFKADAFRGPGAELNEGRDLAAWLLHAALARYILGAFLFDEHASGFSGRSLKSYVRGHAFPTIARQLGLATTVSVKNALVELANGSAQFGLEDFASLQRTYQHVTRAGRHRLVPCLPQDCRRRLPELWRADPLAGVTLSHDPQVVSPEMQFVAAGLRYLNGLGRPDPIFARLFWQTIRVRCLLYRHVVQRPLTPGLQWFIRTFARLSPGKSPMDTCLRVESAGEVSGIGCGLRSLEVRGSPGNDRGQLLEAIQAAERHFRRVFGDRCEFGMVFHLTKDRGGGARDGVPAAHWYRSNADPDTSGRANVFGYRYSTFYQRAREATQTLARVLLDFPMSLRVIRGIDVCTDELGTPTWVFVPLFRYLHDVGSYVSAWLREKHQLEIPPLRTTAHVGEDFVHVLGGLRRIDEALQYLGIREGDRLGHAVALGIDAERWARTVGRVPMMREDRLLDLSWEWSFTARQGTTDAPKRQMYLEREIARLSSAIFGRGLSPHELELLTRLLHDEGALAAVGFPHGFSQRPGGTSMAEHAAFPATVTFRLLRDYLTSPSLFRRGREIEWVDPSSEAETIVRLQGQLRQRIGELGLTVEANPSSNLLIGNLGDMVSHPFWRLDPPTRTDDVAPVATCLGSDDPITFATRLPEEYMLVHDSLILSGQSYAAAADWIARIRENGLRSRFTIPRIGPENLRDLRGGIDQSQCRPLL